MTTELNDRMRALLSKELEHAAALVKLLRNERDLLTTDSAAVQTSAQAKQKVIDELELLHRQRVQLLADAGYSADRFGMDHYLRCADVPGPLQDLWDRLLAAVTECREANQVNAAIVEAGRRTVRDTLALLHGQTPGASTYAADGQTKDGGLSRSLAKA